MRADECDGCEPRPDGYADVITSRISVTGKLDAEQADRLRVIATKCRIHKTLLATPKIIEELSYGA